VSNNSNWHTIDKTNIDDIKVGIESASGILYYTIYYTILYYIYYTILYYIGDEREIALKLVLRRRNKINIQKNLTYKKQRTRYTILIITLTLYYPNPILS